MRIKKAKVWISLERKQDKISQSRFFFYSPFWGKTSKEADLLITGSMRGTEQPYHLKKARRATPCTTHKQQDAS